MRKLLLFVLALILAPSITSAYTITVNTTNNGSAVNSVGFASNDTANAAQSFTTVGAGTFTDAFVGGAFEGTKTSINYFVLIEADNAGSPSGTPLATSNAHVITDFPAVASFSCAATTVSPGVDFTFASPASLSAATTYWAVLTTSGTYGTPDTGVRWCGDTSSNHSQVFKATTATPSTWVTQTNAAGYFTATIAPAATASAPQTSGLILFGDW